MSRLLLVYNPAQFTAVSVDRDTSSAIPRAADRVLYEQAFWEYHRLVTFDVFLSMTHTVARSVDVWHVSYTFILRFL